jgi:sulfur-carrier protein adenylyltransferase/sulfurtransferase
MTGLKDLMAEAGGRVQAVSAEELKTRQDGGEAILVVDVRERHEFEQGHLPGAVNIPRGWLEIRAASDSPTANPVIAENPDACVVTYCTQAPGARSLFSAATLMDLGFTNVLAMRGGLNEWSDSGYSVDEGRSAAAT